MQTRWKKWGWILFAVYCCGMLWLLLGQRIGAPAHTGWNLKPFDTIARYLWVLQHGGSRSQQLAAVANLAGNVFLFLPLGFCLSVLFPAMRSGLRFVLTAGSILILVELCQLLTGLGTLDVDDFLLNALGVMLGRLLWRWRRSLSFRK